MTHLIARVALPVPLDKNFDYLIKPNMPPVIGGRVLVPFGRQRLVGIVVAIGHDSDFPIQQLKPIQQVLDNQPLWQPALFGLLKWASSYYQYPLGDALANAMPALLRKGREASAATLKYWQLTDAGREQPLNGLKRAPKQAQILNLLRSGPLSHDSLLTHDVSSTTLKAVMQKGWITEQQQQPKQLQWQPQFAITEQKPRLNEEQALAIATVNSNPDFGCYLLDGVTGSGKTEVYLNLLEPILAAGKQALILVPEIGLTPQTINRFKRRFNVPLETVHSGLNDSERMTAWLAGRDNQAGIIIGTRSALFTPFANLGIIIVDEEHDASYKQQDSLRYHARDLAVMRANKENIPIVLGSATPALETLHNAQTGKYHYLTLSKRAGNASAARHGVIDVKGLYLNAGLSAPLIAEMRKHLNAGNQVMLFLNRRGFSPAMMCHECGWIAECDRCDAYYTLHQQSGELRCHHCATQRPIMHQCLQCGSTQLSPVGVGTEQLEAQLAELFPEFKTVRIDRDSTRRKGALENYLEAIKNNEYQILIGTQMLAKGHHFPNVTLVALIDVDSALFSNDFRASERLAQLFIQVAGRAGRASKPGSVLLQTHHPEHQLLQSLLHKGYGVFSKAALTERRQALLPPFTHLVLLRAEANDSDLVCQFLQQIRAIFEASPVYDQDCCVLGPNPAPLARRAGRFRWQLILQIPNRNKLQQMLSIAKPAIQLLPLAKKIRWSIDVEPQDLT
ncbi:primosomal protein N' [Photobacterium phosphoreum]|uniref:Replication restart protein PriA n=1 Tax=Photobacterium phosphoreum TaxID=659 RepID=A0AAW4ZRH4_PHOPO|nr:primosomal protein N' [Photobacterium phosphoreum]MCD9479771.1 primosomal protein N' [Photobacterium phosphoreum]MCD9483836.1 primosomal protein N' [Photobacterium phosphoreum]MCD9490565.1 primosomal protein N' [Photobacterium phosphoreum]MCF2189892.1 primosomal protein N' [Photobacterium phosphoreum]MCF2301737.1 primosomal protein N' [Photobacterium phosphoreum]